MHYKITNFDTELLNKEATLMAQGNGFLGLRATHEENYRNQDRGFFIRGVYDRGIGQETSDLVNLPDFIEDEVRLNDEVVSIWPERITDFERSLDYTTGQLIRKLTWKDATGKRYLIVNKRIVNPENVHQVAFRSEITPIDAPVSLSIKAGFNAQVSNGGVQHLLEREVLVTDDVIAVKFDTMDTDIGIGLSMRFNSPAIMTAKNRKTQGTITGQVQIKETFVFEKLVHVYSSHETPKPYEAARADSVIKVSYNQVLEEASKHWEKYWASHRIVVDSTNPKDQEALDFALYHMKIMLPNDHLPFAKGFSIGAKGLTGEGYKGHVFWDTEIFLLPFYLHHEPEAARKLLEYRSLRLAGARDKAADNGYKGAQFPWESALTGFEETPHYAAINIKTGRRQIIASAQAEHHIVSDIAYAVKDYYQATKDETFMNSKGKKLLKETAEFWISRTVEKNGRLEILDVIGPDEYTEHIDNNAYTNYMAAENVRTALQFNEEDEKFSQDAVHFLNNVYLPVPNEEGLIPQDDTFLSKVIIDLTKYKATAGSQSILLDYSREEVVDMQILKQADLVMLFYLMPYLFDEETMKKNLYYYEDKTIHDSSLSKAIHAIVAARIGEADWAYDMFQSACAIDLNDMPHKSDDGIHAASQGAIWLATVFGFAGLVKSEGLEINPKLPSAWTSLEHDFIWRNQKLHFKLTHDTISITKSSVTPLPLTIVGKDYELIQELTVNY
ncbi:glycoside hydrolase family 65 protein [Lactococcus garvieae]|uniref:glycoside hydrolase family 65 protein n=1 Tax=Lactococcus garvieae TaxID=1363 RepID=UPI0018D88C12|nr:glycoside hydrolase family 65 protein [Lactococcus garvieae]QPS71638.1 glycoside hydrolase family 65 protein [Lactococcus garvieae]